MSARLTAEQARDQAKAKDPFATVDAILAMVEAASGDGKYEIQVRQFGFGSGDYYTGEANWPAFGKAVIKELTELGYKCRIRSREAQFVDIWLEVNWEWR